MWWVSFWGKGRGFSSGWWLSSELVDFPDMWQWGERKQRLRSERLELFIMKGRPGSCWRDVWVHIHSYTEWDITMGLTGYVGADPSATSALSIVWPLQTGGRECIAEESPSERKDRRQTTSGTNKIWCPREFMIYNKLSKQIVKSCQNNPCAHFWVAIVVRTGTFNSPAPCPIGEHPCIDHQLFRQIIEVFALVSL